MLLIESRYAILLTIICAFSLTAQNVGILVRKDDRSFDGYDLIFPNRSTTAYLADNSGKIVHRWETAYAPAFSSYLLPNGHLLTTGISAAPTSIERAGGGRVVHEYDWNGKLVWGFQYQDDHLRLHHDIQPLPNGNVLMIAWERKTAGEALAAGRRSDLLLATGSEIWPDHIIEVSPAREGAIVWEWHVWDHLIQDTDPAKPNYGAVAEHPERIDINFNGDRANPLSNRSPDWNHFNAISYNAELDQNYLENGRYSPKEISWSYQHPALAARVQSGAQRLPNGNTFICDAVTGRTTEVTTGGDTVREFTISPPGSDPSTPTVLFRAPRYQPDYPGLANLALKPDPFTTVNAASGLAGANAPGELIRLLRRYAKMRRSR